MKKEYIAPAIGGIRTGVICTAHAGSLTGIRPDQDLQNEEVTDTYYDNPDASAVYSNERADFGSESGPWESLW
ncbi:MAG: hypothetical protein KBT29_02400 [Prevotellaceae bacterium]|nr:hypothetical protein [Candidatus Minthosoma caballi]